MADTLYAPCHGCGRAAQPPSWLRLGAAPVLLIYACSWACLERLAQLEQGAGGHG
jgi:hypothetical protein